MLDGQLLCTKILEVNLSAFAYRLFHEDFSQSRGVCMLFKKGFEYKILSTHSDGIGRLLLVNIDVNEVNWTLCNVYCPDNVTERFNFLSQITSFNTNMHYLSKICTQVVILTV